MKKNERVKENQCLCAICLGGETSSNLTSISMQAHNLSILFLQENCILSH